MHEVKIRTPAPLHRAINFASAKRGIAASALVSLAVYEYLRERDELASTQVDEAQARPEVVIPNPWVDDE